MIDNLISGAQNSLTCLGIATTLMMVRGDGALISAQITRDRPIETILSSPAASIVGKFWLTNAPRALVFKIGSTKTYIAVLRNGHPIIEPASAQVGSFRTMVEAVAMPTSSLEAIARCISIARS